MKEQVSVDRACDCGKKLSNEEIEYYGYSCDECEKKALDSEDDSALPDITGYMVIPPEEYERLKRLELEVNRLEELKKENKELLSALKEVGEFERLKRLDENVKKRWKEIYDKLGLHLDIDARENLLSQIELLESLYK